MRDVCVDFVGYKIINTTKQDIQNQGQREVKRKGGTQGKGRNCSTLAQGHVEACLVQVNQMLQSYPLFFGLFFVCLTNKYLLFISSKKKK